MMLPEQWESVVEDRLRDWDKEMQHRQLLAHVPATPSRWQRWAGSAMVWLGTWLLRLGARMARRENTECVCVTA